MADSDITVDGLTAAGGIGQVVLQWNTPVDPHTPDGLTYWQLKAIDVYAGTVNDFDALTTEKIGEQPASNNFVHSGLALGATFYYWIVPRNRSGSEGERFPSSATGGIVGMEANNDVLLETNGYFRNFRGLIEQWGYYEQTTLGGSPVPIDFPVQFPNRCFNVVASATSSAFNFGINTHPDDVGQPSTGEVFGVTGFTILAQQGARISWRAVGR